MRALKTKDYWDAKFFSGISHRGQKKQTTEYARTNVNQLTIGMEFSGTIIDFGCALGDAIPVYAKAFPRAKLLGIDISEVAIALCEKRYGALAEFLCGDHTIVPCAEVIISSHVMEHIYDDKQIIRELIAKCNDLFVFVPYKESPLYCEHVNYYDEFYYDDIGVAEKKIFNVNYKIALPLFTILKNFLRCRFCVFANFSKDRIMFHFKGEKNQLNAS
jgi:hypothetical protein